MIPAVTGVEPTAPDIEETVTYVKDAQKRSSNMSMKKAMLS